MNLKRYFALSVFLFAVADGAFAQLQQPYRFEKEVKSSDENFVIISLKKEGLAIIRDTEKHEQGKKKWQLEIVDTTLANIWSRELLLESNLTLVGYEYTPEHLYLLYREGESEQYNFQLLTILFHEKWVQTDKVKFEVNFRMTHFTVSGSSAVFGGYVLNEPAVLLYDQSSDHPKVLPGLFISQSTLLDVRANQNQSFNVLLSETIGKDKKRLVHRTFDHQGNLLIDDMIEIDPRYTILSGITSGLEREELLIVGTYAEGNARTATGFFSVVVDPFNDQSVSYIDFPSLPHFLDFISSKRAGKIKQKAHEERVAGRVPDYKVNVTPIRIEEKPNGFYVLSEVYYPSSSGSFPYQNSYYSPMMYGYYGSPYRGSRMNDRYYNSPSSAYNTPARNSEATMMESTVMELNANGTPKKDLSIKLDELKQLNAEQVSDFLVRHDSLFLVYKKEGDLFFQKEVADSVEMLQPHSVKIKLKDENDAWKSESEDGGTRFWYDHHFYVWGYQTVKNSMLKDDQTRRVFYINRVSVQ